MQTMWRNPAAATALFCSLTIAGAQQRPSVLDQLPGRLGERSQVPEHSNGGTGTATRATDDLVRKQTAAILDLAERIARLEKRVAELETKRDNR